MFNFWKRKETPFRAEPKPYSLEELREFLKLDENLKEITDEQGN
jgi:hypothetical protein